MPTEDKPNTEALKHKKEWLIDAKKGMIYYDVSKDVEAGWWHKIKTRAEHKDLDQHLSWSMWP
jgi:hypothetical protein